MEEHLAEEQRSRKAVNLSKMDGEASALSGVEEIQDGLYTGSEKCTLETEKIPFTLDPCSVASAADGDGDTVESQLAPDFNGTEDSVAESLDIKVKLSKNDVCLSGRDREQRLSKMDGTNQSLSEFLHELREYDHMKRSDGVCSESPYDTDCTKKLISSIQNVSSQEALLEDIESELLSTDLLQEHKLPNGVCKSEVALTVFEKCAQDKYLQQEHTIKK